MIKEVGIIFVVVIVLIYIFYDGGNFMVGKKKILAKKKIPERKEIKTGTYVREKAGIKTIESTKTGEVLELGKNVNTTISSQESKIAPITIDQVQELIDEATDSTEELPEETTSCFPDPRYYGGTLFD